MKLIASILFVLAAAGWILNIVKLMHLSGDTIVLILRAVGVFFPPVGAVLGFL